MERHDISHFEETRKIEDVCIITHHFPYPLLVCVWNVSDLACNLQNSNLYTNDIEANPKVFRVLVPSQIL